MDTTDRLVRDLAIRAIDKIVRRTIRELQAQTDGLQSGDDSGLANLWDEVCVQLQLEKSFYWSSYEQAIESILLAHLDRLSQLELEAIWLQTNAGFDWLWDNPETQDPAPIVLDDIVEQAFEELRARAADWTNHRVRAYLDRNASFD